jgi:hypothetical protein
MDDPMEHDCLFIDALCLHLRFPSCRGELTTEQLFEIPLTSRSGFDIDTITRGVNAELREESAGSFVTTTPSRRQAILELQMAILKAVIARKQAAVARTVAAESRAQERQRLRDALATKDAEALSAATREELMAQLAALDAE